MRLARLIEEKRNLRFWKGGPNYKNLTYKNYKNKILDPGGPRPLGPPPRSVLAPNKEIVSNGLP